MLAGRAELGEVILHAGLDPPAAGLNAGALLLGFRFANPGYRDIGYQGILARCRQLTEMVPYAGHEAAVTGFNPLTDLVEVFGTSSVRRTLLCDRSGRSQQEKYDKTKRTHRP